MNEPLPMRIEVEVVATHRHGTIVEVLVEQDDVQETTWYVVAFEDGERVAYQQDQIRWVRQTLRAGASFLASADFQARLAELRKQFLGR